MLHAGVAPQWSLEQTLELSAEVEIALQGDDYRAYLTHMYGDTPRRWHDGLEGLDRLRVITNYLTRVRYCDAIGNMQLKAKEGLAMAPHGYKPWFMYENISERAQILFGHWAALEGHTGKPRVHALDTGFVWGQKLTALRLEDGKRFAYSKT
jgi:bis(5'-nucleosyl)-tetraphosphatase (symmetrical)